MFNVGHGGGVTCCNETRFYVYLEELMEGKYLRTIGSRISGESKFGKVDTIPVGIKRKGAVARSANCRRILLERDDKRGERIA